jgi:hypothetical protein
MVIIQEDLGRNRLLPFKYDKDRIENDASNNSSIIACIFIAALMFFSVSLPSNDTYRHTDWWEGFM